jgi:hypothetical protein
MTKLTDILKEIKINNPSDIFIITDKGKEALQNYHNLNKLLEYFGAEPLELMSDADLPAWFDILNLSIYEDEKIISTSKENNVKDFIYKLINYLGSVENEEEAKDLLKDLKNRGWIR